ncbi:MAG: hypothetical protein GQ544_00965 [Candidatus Aminicenantes bacterium]|nr:hypothetical protein [Candidatus Aminicenantes bacterium]
MRRASTIFMVCCFLWGGVISTFAQEAEKQKTEDISTSELLKIGKIIYNPAGRRDPFRDLLSGSEVPEATAAEGVAGMLINDIVLIGIAKVKGKHQAIINGPQGFPNTINVGTKFADGFVLSIDASKVVFRQTKDRGVPLYKPKDITKEINPEER